MDGFKSVDLGAGRPRDVSPSRSVDNEWVMVKNPSQNEPEGTELDNPDHPKSQTEEVETKDDAQATSQIEQDTKTWRSSVRKLLARLDEQIRGRLAIITPEQPLEGPPRAFSPARIYEPPAVPVPDARIPLTRKATKKPEDNRKADVPECNALHDSPKQVPDNTPEQQVATNNSTPKKRPSKKEASGSRTFTFVAEDIETLRSDGETSKSQPIDIPKRVITEASEAEPEASRSKTLKAPDRNTIIIDELSPDRHDPPAFPHGIPKDELLGHRMNDLTFIRAISKAELEASKPGGRKSPAGNTMMPDGWPGITTHDLVSHLYPLFPSVLPGAGLHSDAMRGVNPDRMADTEPDKERNVGKRETESKKGDVMSCRKDRRGHVRFFNSANASNHHSRDTNQERGSATRATHKNENAKFVGRVPNAVDVDLVNQKVEPNTFGCPNIVLTGLEGYQAPSGGASLTGGRKVERKSRAESKPAAISDSTESSEDSDDSDE
ncbi:hypothetical protein PVAG01_07564 [Phlyctema vagabunda]|uniref:Uncharacterized protein n=1 Tax=Phlyctema vagabunda TaxID=108571 RepID=A0ABR4PCS1_9HELO